MQLEAWKRLIRYVGRKQHGPIKKAIIGFQYDPNSFPIPINKTLAPSTWPSWVPRAVQAGNSSSGFLDVGLKIIKSHKPWSNWGGQIGQKFPARKLCRTKSWTLKDIKTTVDFVWSINYHFHLIFFGVYIYIFFHGFLCKLFLETWGYPSKSLPIMKGIWSIIPSALLIAPFRSHQHREPKWAPFRQF